MRITSALQSILWSVCLTQSEASSVFQISSRTFLSGQGKITALMFSFLVRVQNLEEVAFVLMSYSTHLLCVLCRNHDNTHTLSLVPYLLLLWQGLSCACQVGAFPWPWWLVLWCWEVSCWCQVWHTCVVTGRYSRLSSSAPFCLCCHTSGKKKT